MFKLSLFFCLFLSIFSFCQKKLCQNVIKTNNDSFYLICRGTTSKIGFISDFNLKDKNITHVGIGVIENNKITIYNVNNEENKNGNLFIENLESFINPTDINYLSIWECKSNYKEIKLLKEILNNYKSIKITFDMDFSENGPYKLYCSEFCATVLRKLNPKKYNYYLNSKNLDLAYTRALHREILNYYPVDFFQINNRFNKIYETFY